MFDWFLDYMCNQDDLALIESIKNIPCATMDVELVCVGSQVISRKFMECLFQPDSYLGDEVILFLVRMPTQIYSTRTYEAASWWYSPHRDYICQ
jgi:hypothetical protein